MLLNNFRLNNFINTSKTKGALGEYYMVMDNCGGQNKNRMVLRFFLMMCKLGILKKAGNIYLVRGHTKNACDCMFMLLKQHFHYKNLYTMGHLHTNLNKNDGVKAILITGEQFFDLDKILDIYYKRPESGSVNTTHIFTMSADKPGIMELKDSTDSVVRVQDLRRGNLSDADRVAGLTRALLTIQPMKKSGLKPIKQI